MVNSSVRFVLDDGSALGTDGPAGVAVIGPIHILGIALRNFLTALLAKHNRFAVPTCEAIIVRCRLSAAGAEGRVPNHHRLIFFFPALQKGNYRIPVVIVGVRRSPRYISRLARSGTCGMSWAMWYSRKVSTLHPPSICKG